ncbi:MAG: radical SAM protein [Nitrospirae bacterium]|nr:radical SAM protein [Nitrospirota bacterium]
MNVQEWIEKSKIKVMKGAETLPPFGTPDYEFQELHLELTYACNLRCRMCNVWGVYRNDRLMPRKEMSVEELVDYIEESRILKRIQGLVISGGEPFLKKGFQELCAYFMTHYPELRVGILSNLYNRELILRRLKDLRNFTQRIWIGTSLDGLHELHDNTRGVKDAFSHFQESLKMLGADFPEVPVVVNYTLTTDNYRGIHAAYKYCRERSLDLSIQFPVAWEGAETFTFSEEQLKEIEGHLIHIMEDAVKDFEAGKMDDNGLMAKIFYLSGLMDYQRKPGRVFERCIAGRRFTAISPEGKVYFCPLLKNRTVGDLREKPFDEIWNSREANDLRKKIDRGFCDCWLNCTIYPNASESLEEKKPEKYHEEEGLLRKLFGMTMAGKQIICY